MFSGIVLLIITVQTLHFTNRASAKSSGYNQTPIKYPGPIREIGNRYGTADPVEETVSVPESCQGKTFCTVRPPNYPQRKFDNMFKGHKQVQQAAPVPDDMFDNRQGDPSETDGCDTTVSYEPLYQVRHGRDGDWRTVIQAPEEDFIQRVRLEECKNPKSNCFTIAGDLGVETFCKQKFNVWEVLVSDGKGGSERIKTELPVCCSCHYRL